MPQKKIAKIESKKDVKKVVLIIEDEELLLTLLRDELEAAGYKVMISKTGEDGLFQLKNTKKIDLILLDLILPKMDGFSVLKQLKYDSRFNHIPVVVLSNLGEEQNIKRAFELGAKDYFIKADMTPDKIIVIVNKLNKIS